MHEFMRRFIRSTLVRDVMTLESFHIKILIYRSFACDRHDRICIYTQSRVHVLSISFAWGRISWLCVGTESSFEMDNIYSCKNRTSMAKIVFKLHVKINVNPWASFNMSQFQLWTVNIGLLKLHVYLAFLALNGRRHDSCRWEIVSSKSYPKIEIDVIGSTNDVHTVNLIVFEIAHRFEAEKWQRQWQRKWNKIYKRDKNKSVIEFCC